MLSIHFIVINLYTMTMIANLFLICYNSQRRGGGNCVYIAVIQEGAHNSSSVEIAALTKGKLSL